MFELNQLSPKKTFSRIGWILTLYICMIQGIAFLVSYICYKFYPEVLSISWFSWVESIVIFYIIAFPVYATLMKDIPEKKPQQIKKYNIGQILCLFTISYGAGFAGNLISIAITAIVGKLVGHSLINPIQIMLDNADLGWTILVVSILAPIFEELTFRKILLNKLLPYGNKIAIIVSAFAFALCHGNLSQMIYAFILGVIFAYIAIASGTIKYTIILHSMINFIGSVILPRLVLGQNILITIIVGMSVYLIIILGIIFFVIFRKTLFPKLPDVNDVKNVNEIEAINDINDINNLSDNNTIINNNNQPNNKSNMSKLSDVFLTPGMLAFSIACIALIAYSIIITQ